MSNRVFLPRPASAAAQHEAVVSSRRQLSDQKFLTAALPPVWFELACDANQRYCFPYVSQSVQQMLGISAGSLQADAGQFWQLIHGADLPLLQRTFRTVAGQLPDNCHCQFRIVRNGQIRWISVAARAQAGTGGSVTWHGQFHDLNPLRQAAHDLRAGAVQRELIGRSGRLGLFDFDAASVEDPVSQACLPLLGYQRGDFPDVASSRHFFWRKCLHPADLGALQYSFLFQFPSPGKGQNGWPRSAQLPFRLRNKAGEWRRFRASASVVEWDQLGRPSRLVGHYLDLGSLHAEPELPDAGHSISVVSHELRTPLTSIRGSLSLLEAGKVGELPETALKMVRIAHSNSLRLIGLVNDILDLNKLSGGHMQLKAEPLDLAGLLRDAIEANEAYAADFGVTLEARLPTGSAGYTGDYDRLMQVMNNLISNAVKFSPRGKPVQIQLNRTASCYRIAVSDAGAGIPPEFQQRLFDYFAQAGHLPGRPRQGSGLGLPISKALIEAMGGQIFFSTAAGRGTSFWFELPLTLAPASD